MQESVIILCYKVTGFGKKQQNLLYMKDSFSVGEMVIFYIFTTVKLSPHLSGVAPFTPSILHMDNVRSVINRLI